MMMMSTYIIHQMKMKQLENLVSVEAVEDDSELVMRFPKPYCSFSPDEVLISLNSVSFRWPSETAASSSSASSSSVVAVEEEEEKGASLFERVDLCIRATSRIVILGKNGCGKRKEEEEEEDEVHCVQWWMLHYHHHRRHCMHLVSQS